MCFRFYFSLGWGMNCMRCLLAEKNPEFWSGVLKYVLLINILIMPGRLFFKYCILLPAQTDL